MKVRLYTNTIPKLGDRLTISFVDTDGKGEVVIMGKVERQE